MKIHSDLAVTGPGICDIRTSCAQPTGGGSYDPAILLEPKAHYPNGEIQPLDEQTRTYDTFEGPDKRTEEDWYEISFKYPRTVNRFVMITGLPYVDGGWWTSLRFEYLASSNGRWQELEGFDVFPSYDFTDSKAYRRPFECYVFVFRRLKLTKFRISGKPGGVARFTSTSTLTLYDVPESQHPLQLHHPVPIPRLFQLISGELLWRLSQDFVAAIGLSVQCPFLEFYSDIVHSADHDVRTTDVSISSKVDLWGYLGLRTGWQYLSKAADRGASRRHVRETGPYVEYYFDGRFARACAPIIVDGDLLGTLYTAPPVPVEGQITFEWIEDSFDIDASDRAFAELLRQAVYLSESRLKGISGLLGNIASEAKAIVTRRLFGMEESSFMSGDDHFRFPYSARRIVRNSLDIIDQHVSGPLSVAELSDMLGITPSYLAQVYRLVTGKHPNRVIAQRKIDYAKMCLERYGLSIVDVGYLVGYSPSQFYRLFKKFTGVSPQEYRGAVNAAIARR